MKIIFNSGMHHYVTRISIFLIIIALIAGMISCGGGGVEYHLAISSTAGGSVTTPGEDTYTYDEGEVVDLVVTPDAGYRFVEWTGEVNTIANINSASTTITMNGDYSITAKFIAQYVLMIGSIDGGNITTPGEGTFTYDAGTVVDLVAEPEDGYQFINWTGDVGTIADVNDATTNVTMNGNYTIAANFALEIWDWYDLDGIRDNLGGSYLLMNNLDSTTAGYGELASPTANGGKGWQPIGIAFNAFTGDFDGQGYEICDLFIDRPDESGMGLFNYVDVGAVVQNVGVVNATVTGYEAVGSLAGQIDIATVSNCYSTGSITGYEDVGGLVGYNQEGTVSNSYSISSVTGEYFVGGLVGVNPEESTVSNSYSTGNVNGNKWVGGLVGSHSGTVSNSYSTGRVAGDEDVGGLVGESIGGVINSFWDIETSGQSDSPDGTGKTTAEMHEIATFSVAGWNIIDVSPGECNPSYIWNIVDGETYPFLSWES